MKPQPVWQSSGWLVSRNSSTFLRASATFVVAVRTTSPSLTYAAQVGLRVRFGQTGTLLDQDRNGATLKAPEFDHVGWLRWDD